MRVSDFDFHLPPERIAQQAAEPRDAARLLVLDRARGTVEHRHVRDLPEFLVPGDLLVVNDTRVLPCRLVGRRATGGRVEALVLERDGGVCTGFLRPAAKVRHDARVAMEDGALWLTPGEPQEGGMHGFLLEAADGDLEATLERVGRAPLPPYVRRDGDEDPAADRDRYQTVFADRPGAVAAPTAGLHFTPELLDRLGERGVEVARVTLHVGPGTFAPVRAEEVEDHRMHAERYEIGEAAAGAVAATRERGGRVIAVGTTSVRTLESQGRPGRLVAAGAGSTELFLVPGSPIRVVDALMTNFHLPCSTLLMLVSAFVPRERLLEVYAEAVAREYRFYSFGDAMLVL